MEGAGRELRGGLASSEQGRQLSNTGTVQNTVFDFE